MAVFVCFSWTVIGFLNQFSSYILYFRIAEIAEILAFMMSIALLESFILTGLLTLLAFILPRKWMMMDFAVKGSLLVVVFTIAAFFVQRSLNEFFPSPFFLVTAFAIPLVVSVILIFLVRALPVLHRLLLAALDRLQIMLFVYIPLGVVSLLVVLFRNLI